MLRRKSKFGLAGMTVTIIIISLIVAGGVGVAIAAGTGAFSPSAPYSSSPYSSAPYSSAPYTPRSSAPSPSSSGAQVFSGTTCPTGWDFSPEKELCVTPSIQNVSFLDSIDPETGDIFVRDDARIPENLVNSCVNVGGTLSPGNGLTYAPKCEQPGTLCGSMNFPDPRYLGEGRICLWHASPAQIAARSDQSSTVTSDYLYPWPPQGFTGCGTASDPSLLCRTTPDGLSEGGEGLVSLSNNCIDSGGAVCVLSEGEASAPVPYIVCKPGNDCSSCPLNLLYEAGDAVGIPYSQTDPDGVSGYNPNGIYCISSGWLE